MCIKHTKTNLVFLHIVFFLCICGYAGYAQLKADFTVDKTGGCSPLSVSFTNKTTGASANAAYKWDFGNGNTAVHPNPGAIFINEQDYTVTLTVEDGGQTSSKTQTITVYKKPTVDFTTNTTKGCIPAAITFTSNSSAGSGSLASYYWDFGDGTTQQGFGSSQSHTYNMVQKAPVMLTVTNTYGCYNTIQKKDVVQILPSLTAGFTSDKRVLCKETDAVQFTNNSNGPGTLSYVWDFGDGSTSTATHPSHAFNKKGIYTVKLTVNNSEGCTSSSVQTNYLNVASYNTEFDVPSLICKNSYVTFNAKSTPAPNTSEWKINDAHISYYGYLSHYFNNAGTYSIKLINTFGTCVDSAVHQVTAHEIPDLRGFIMETKDSCGAPTKVSFKDTTATAVKWEWDFSHDYWNPKVQATTQAPVHTYAADGSYTVLLKVFNAAGCSSSISKYFQTIRPYVTIYPVTQSNICGSLSCSFKCNSSDPIVSYKWDFGDGNTSTSAEPSHTYTTPGTWQVSLNYTTRAGCTGTAHYNSMTVYRKYEADFTASQTQVCGNNPVLFNSVLTPPQGNSNIWYRWDFGDGTGGYYSSTSHSYSKEGTYTIQLIVDNGPCSDTIIKTNYIKVLPPFPRFLSATNTCNGTRGAVTFTQLTDNATSITWNFGDGNTATTAPGQTTVTHTYTKSGSYSVALSATNNTCVITTNTAAQVLLKQNPVLTADNTVICAEGTLNVKVSPFEKNPRNNNTWDSDYYIRFQYADGTNFNGPVYSNDPYWKNAFTGSLSYFDKSKQNLRAISTSYGFGCQDTTNYVPLQIKSANAGFEIVTHNVCYKNPVVLKDTSKVVNTTIQSWQWDFGDGQTSTQSGIVSHTYSSPGYYNVILRITDATGCVTSSTTASVNVLGPKAAFGASGTNVSLNSTVYFYNYTNASGASNTTYQWYINGVPFSTGYSPSYTFDKPGTYTIKLVASDAANSCSSEYTQTVVVNNFNAAFTFTTSFITASSCPPVLMRINNTSINYTRLIWDFGDGYTLDNVAYPSHIYEKAGKYVITLFAYGPNGLTGTYIDSVFIKEPKPDLQTSSTEGCIGHMVTLNASTQSTASYIWDFGDGSLIQTADSFATHQYTTPGTYSPMLLMKETPNGCAAATTLNDKINIHANPEITFSPADPLVCLGSSVTLQANGGSVYEWSPATGLSNTNTAAPVASPATTTSYTVKVTDAIGCYSTAPLKVTVVQPVTVSVTADTSICKGNSVQLQAAGAELYNWINNTAELNNTQIANPIAQPAVTTEFTVTGSDIHLCFTDTAKVTVGILPLPWVEAGSDAEVWVGEPAQLHATGSPDVISWNWTPPNYLSCTGCADPLSKPQAQTTYTVTVKNQYGCRASDSLTVKIFCNEGRVAIPNGFTPNGDGVNDVFIIKGISIIKHLVIYNRWGQKVFERNNFIAGDRSLCWDGNFNGYPAAEGTYVYFAELECPSGAQFARKGTVTLLR